MRFDALVVGAGPAGSTAALLLARAGWSVALVEKSAFPRRKVCGEYISPAGLALLDRHGLGARIDAMAGPEVRRVGLFVGEAQVISPMPARRSARAYGRALGREHLDALLCDEAVRAGASLFQPAKLVALARVGGAHHAKLEGPDGIEEVRSRIVVAAGGSWERGPLTAAAPPHRPGDLLAFKAHFRRSGLAEDLMPLLMFPGGYGGMVRTDGGRTSLSLCIRRDALAELRAAHPALSAGETVLDHVRVHCRGADEALDGASLDGPFLSAGPIRTGIRMAHRDGVFRVGNAAGEAHPVIAEGISMAIGSSAMLCRWLIADETSAGTAYAADWRRRFAPRIRFAAALAELARRPSTAALSASATERLPTLLSWGAGISGKAL